MGWIRRGITKETWMSFKLWQKLCFIVADVILIAVLIYVLSNQAPKGYNPVNAMQECSCCKCSE